MNKVDEIFDTIVKSLEEASNEEMASAYFILVGCGKCPYWHDCKNEFPCDDYILEKLEKGDKE